MWQLAVRSCICHPRINLVARACMCRHAALLRCLGCLLRYRSGLASVGTAALLHRPFPSEPDTVISSSKGFSFSCFWQCVANCPRGRRVKSTLVSAARHCCRRSQPCTCIRAPWSVGLAGGCLLVECRCWLPLPSPTARLISAAPAGLTPRLCCAWLHDQQCAGWVGALDTFALHARHAWLLPGAATCTSALPCQTQVQADG